MLKEPLPGRTQNSRSVRHQRPCDQSADATERWISRGSCGQRHSPGSQQPADARSRRPGWHKRPVPGRQLMPHSAKLKGAQIYRQQKARQTNTYSETCLYQVLYGCGRMPGQRPPP
jgi:hypothetical protein